MSDNDPAEKTEKSDLTEKPKKAKKTKHKKVEYNATKVYRILYGLGFSLTVMALVMSMIGHSGSVAVCHFGYLDPHGELVVSFYDMKKSDMDKHKKVDKLKPYQMEFGLWKYCLNDECGSVSGEKERTGSGEVSVEFIKMGMAQGAMAMLIMSHMVGFGLAGYFIFAMYKLSKKRIALAVLTSCFLLLLMIGCALYTQWFMDNMDPYDGYCELSYNFLMPWLAFLFSVFGLVAINVNMHLLGYISMK